MSRLGWGPGRCGRLAAACAAAALLFAGCEEEKRVERGGRSGGSGSAAPKAAAATPAAPAPQSAVEKLRNKPLRDEDFFESELNRDPFRSFMRELSEGSRRAIDVDVKVKFKEFGCEELKLIAIISGALNPHAMFRDPRGVGLTVSVGDRICRSGAKVVRIVQDAVIVETEEDLGGPTRRPVQKRLSISNEEEVLLPLGQQ